MFCGSVTAVSEVMLVGQCSLTDVLVAVHPHHFHILISWITLAS